MTMSTAPISMTPTWTAAKDMARLASDLKSLRVGIIRRRTGMGTVDRGFIGHGTDRDGPGDSCTVGEHQHY